MLTGGMGWCVQARWLLAVSLVVGTIAVGWLVMWSLVLSSIPFFRWVRPVHVLIALALQPCLCVCARARRFCVSLSFPYVTRDLIYGSPQKRAQSENAACAAAEAAASVSAEVEADAGALERSEPSPDKSEGSELFEDAAEVFLQGSASQESNDKKDQ